jgi:ABC-type uncharacterized transport system ATPase subunit
MNPQDVKDFFGTLYNFRKQTKMAHASLINWLKWGYVPEGSQYKIERLTKGKLKADWSYEHE